MQNHRTRSNESGSPCDNNLPFRLTFNMKKRLMLNSLINIYTYTYKCIYITLFLSDLIYYIKSRFITWQPEFFGKRKFLSREERRVVARQKLVFVKREIPSEREMKLEMH